MQRGSLMRVSRKQGPDVWQFRWSERDLNRRRVYRKKVLGSVGRYADEAAARCAVTVFLAEINSEKVRMSSRSLTVAQLCDHFEQRELARQRDLWVGLWVEDFDVRPRNRLSSISQNPQNPNRLLR